MWIFSTLGFFSITRSPKEPNKYQVRARERADLVALLDACQETGREVFLKVPRILETPAADYRWRIITTDVEVAGVLGTLEETITYQNFKAAVGSTPGQRHKLHALHDVWNIMHQLQEAERMREQKRGQKCHPADQEQFPDPELILDNPRSRKPVPKRRKDLAQKATQAKAKPSI